RVFNRYISLLSDREGYQLQVQEDNTERAHWMFPIYVHGKSYDDMESHMKEHGIDVRPFFYPINMHHHLITLGTDDPISVDLSTHIVILPSYPMLREDQQERVIDTLCM